MFWREKFDMFVGVYTGAYAPILGIHQVTEILDEGLRIIVHDNTISASEAALQFVQWKLGLVSEPPWTKP